VEDYISAMKNISKITESNAIKLGVSKIDVYKSLGGPIDLENGNMNIMVFDIKGYKYGIMQFNSNNMLPSLRESIVRYVKKRYNIDMEVCTTDTHAVNSISIPASNVLGRETKFEKLKPLIDAHILEAITKINSYVIGNEHIDVKNFSVWGKNSRERITAVLSSVISIAKILVPTIIIVGFIAAAWIVSFI
jgi:predicted neutral ceramidase superfamily lipid hydrolase